MISSRQSCTWVEIWMGAESSSFMQPREPAPASTARSERALFIAESLLSAAVARRVEPPLRAEAEEMLEAPQREDVVLRVERPGRRVAAGEAIDEPDLRAAVVAAPRRRDEGDHPEPEEVRRERPGAGRAGGRARRHHAALLRLVRGLDGEPAQLTEEEVGADGEDPLVHVGEVERGARVAERAQV